MEEKPVRLVGTVVGAYRKLTRIVFTSVVLLAIAGGAYLGKLLPQFGTGTGFGIGGGGNSGQTHPETDGKADPADPTEEKSGKRTQETSLVIRINDTQYEVAEGNRSFREISLKEITRRAKSSQPNQDGTRVKVIPTPDSRAKTENDLKEALRSAGIDETEIVWESE